MEYDNMKFIQELVTNINEINTEIDSYKIAITNLERERQHLKDVLHLERAAFFTTEWLPEEIQELDIYFPKKYYITRFLEYPCDYYIVKYDTFRFVLTDRLDFDRLDTFDITNDNFVSALQHIPLHIQIFYREPEKMYANIHSRDHLYDLKTSIQNAAAVLGDNWNENMAFGIAVFYFWILTHYMGDHMKYKTLHTIFGKYT